jgi:hypothetical protein
VHESHPNEVAAVLLLADAAGAVKKGVLLKPPIPEALVQKRRTQEHGR